MPNDGVVKAITRGFRKFYKTLFYDKYDGNKIKYQHMNPIKKRNQTKEFWIDLGVNDNEQNEVIYFLLIHHTVKEADLKKTYYLQSNDFIHIIKEVFRGKVNE